MTTGAGTPLVSVLIPAHNAERWLADAMDSALRQSWRSLEVVVVDDGSTDATPDVAAAFSDPRVRLVRQRASGAPTARNRAFDESRGAFVQYLDADDLLSDDKIEAQMELLRRVPTGCVAVSGTVYFRDGEPPASWHWSAGYPELDSDDPAQWLIDLWLRRRWGMVHPGAWLTPRAVVEAAGGWAAAPSPDDDGEFFTRVVLASRGVRWSRRGWSYYRLHPMPGRVSGLADPVSLRAALEGIDSKRDHLLPRTHPGNAGQAREALARQYRDLAFRAYPDVPDVSRAAEARLPALGASMGTMRFFEHSVAGRVVERALGWRVTKRISRAMRRVGARG